MGSRSSTSAQQARRFLASGLVMIVMIAAVPAFATPMDDYIAFVNETCEKLTQEKERLTRLAYQKGAKATEDTAERMARVSSSVAQAQKLIGEKPLRTPAEQKEFIQKFNDLIKSANMEITTAQHQLGVAQFGAVDINAQNFMQRFSKGFDGNATSSDATPAEVDIQRRPDTNFFDVNQCKADVNRRAKVGVDEFSKCRACTDAVIEQHLADLERFRLKDLADCERGLTRK